MPTIAIVGAGPGLGAAAAVRFGREGFTVALIARSRDRLEGLSTQLAADGIEARAYPADVLARAALSRALETAAAELGPVSVLQYSPLPLRAALRPVLETSVDELAQASDFSILGPATAVEQVLPGMRGLGAGTILFINGTSAVRPNPRYAGTSVAFAGESAYGQMLHEVLAAENIHVGQLVIPGAIGGGDPGHAPVELAERLWRIHTDRGPFRTVVGTDP